MHLTIRKAKIDDAGQISFVHMESWKTTYKGIVSDNFLSQLDIDSRTIQRANNIRENKSINIVADNGEVIGFATAGKNRMQNEYESELYAIYILEKYQRQGIGRKLFLEAVKTLSESGFNSLQVWVLKDNAFKEFYTILGGEYIGEQEIQIGDQTFTAVSYGWEDLKAMYQK